MAKDKSPAPPGSFIRVGVDNLDEGKFKKEFNAKMRKAFRDLMDYIRDSGDASGKSVVTATVTISKTKNTSDHFSLVHSVKAAVPSMKNTSIVKSRNGELLCQPIGASETDPDQQAFFDGNGKLIAGADAETGEVPDVAGRIGQAAQA